MWRRLNIITESHCANTCSFIASFTVNWVFLWSSQSLNVSFNTSTLNIDCEPQQLPQIAITTLFTLINLRTANMDFSWWPKSHRLFDYTETHLQPQHWSRLFFPPAARRKEKKTEQKSVSELTTKSNPTLAAATECLLLLITLWHTHTHTNECYTSCLNKHTQTDLAFLWHLPHRLASH